MQPYTEYNASLTVCTEVGCTTSSNVSIMMPESQPEGKLQCLLSKYLNTESDLKGVKWVGYLNNLVGI